MGERTRYRKPRSDEPNQHQHMSDISETDPKIPQFPCIVQSSRSKSTISSILLSAFSPTHAASTTNDHNHSATSTTTTVACKPKTKNFTSSKFRGMGCTASSHVSVPALIRTSANWEAKKVKKKKQRSKKNKAGFSPSGGNLASTSSNNTSNNSYPSSSPSLAASSSCVAVPDLWCGPGIGFNTDPAYVDCVVSRRPVSGRGKIDGERVTHRERASCSVRRMVSSEDIPFLDPDLAVGMPRTQLDISGSRYHHHGRHGFPEGLAEIVMLQRSLLMGERCDGLDRYKDWRLDVDNMSYEELLELGEKIGYVSTGLREDEIAHCLRKTKLTLMDNFASHVTTEMEKKCSICQEEYEAADEMGKLNCGHFYHIDCIKQWLVQKNCCPVCKTSAASQN